MTALPHYACRYCGVFAWSLPVPHRPGASCDPDSYERVFDGCVLLTRAEQALIKRQMLDVGYLRECQALLTPEEKP